MKLYVWPVVALLAVVMVFGFGAEVLAQTTGTGGATPSNGQLGIQLTQGMYCGFKDLLSGNLGLMLGLIMVAMGVWSLIQGGAAWTAFILIVFGSLVTSLPGLVESSFSGLNTLLKEAKMTTTSYNPPCSSMVGGGKDDPVAGDEELDEDEDFYGDPKPW